MILPWTSPSGLVSRVSPVQTALRNCTGDGGRSSGFGDQVADPGEPVSTSRKRYPAHRVNVEHDAA
jgi:hypothetical protein